MKNPPDVPQLKVAVAGATGFVGQALCQSLQQQHQVIALSRSGESGVQPVGPGIFRVRCDLFSLLEVEQSLQGVDVAFYLVHSMLPSARLTQGSFLDMDLILADNFARAAKTCGVKRIVYLGGIIPPGVRLSKHLQSRREVEQTLASTGVPVTNIRAGLIIGPNGSSFSILVRLVERLPLMLTPRWVDTPTQPIALQDVVSILAQTISEERTAGLTFDIGGPEVSSYRELILLTAQKLGVHPVLLRVPLFSPGLSRLWVSIVTETPKELVAPLIQSLVYPMVASSREEQLRLGVPGKSLEAAIAEGVAETPSKRLEWWHYAGLLLSTRRREIQESRNVRSVQRLPLLSGKNAEWVAAEYARWLPTFMRGLIDVQVDSQRVMRFVVRGLRLILLELSYSWERSVPDRPLYYITGGVLLRKTALKGRLEFREVLGGSHVLAAIHDFTPILPWYIYNLTQAVAHLIVMWAFGRHLEEVSKVQVSGDDEQHTLPV